MRYLQALLSIFLIICFSSCQLTAGKSLSLYQDAEDHFKTFVAYETINPELALEHLLLAKEKIDTLLNDYSDSKISQQLRNNVRKIDGVSLKEFLDMDFQVRD